MIVRSILLIQFFFTGVLLTPVKQEGYTAGNVQCHPIHKTKTNVHLIPHSHDDVGWLKTADQYYYGMNTSIQHAGVQYIITSVYEALLENEDRRFMQVETEFFWRWWKHQNEDTLKKYKSLVDNGQIEFVNGAWSMNDEACSNYQSTIDQFTWGLRTLQETVGDSARPRVGWQIDPFGHSREQASILAQLGYDGVMFARLDHDDKEQRQKKANLDFAWQGSANLDNSVIFGSIFATDLYFPPNGFCWEYECGDDTIDDDPNSVDYNVEDKIKDFTTHINNYKKYFPTNNIIIPMGGDFYYEAAQINYKNMDRLVKAFENNTDINVIYSTPSCYIKAVNEAKPNLTLKTDDFFPYSNDEHSFWAGYFSSRPNSKRFERIGHNILQATKQLYAQNSFISNHTYDDNLRYLRETMGILQHHDAITGTEKQHVANDYVRRLRRGIERVENNLGQVVDELLGNNLNLDLTSCLLSNISICSVSQSSQQFVVVVYNPLAWEVTHYVRLPVEDGTYEVNENEPYDLIPVISNFSYVTVKEGTPSTHELVFAAKVPPMGIKIYHIKKTSNKSSGLNSLSTFSSNAFEIDSESNLLKSVTINGKELRLTQTFKYYISETGETDKTYVSSGAYLFRPTNTTAENMDKVKIINTFSGKIVDEVHQQWNTDAAEVLQIIRWYKNENYIEFDWIVGNIDVEKTKNGKEIISRFTITDDFNNNNVFYTDSNGRELIKRTKDKRTDYTYNHTIEPVAGNYYPVTSKIVIKDEKENVQLSVLTDRSQGGSSLASNEIELMVHRRLLHDDDKGVGESLNETEFGKGVYVRGSHYLVIGKAKGENKNDISTAALERILAQKKLLQPWIGVAAVNESYKDLKDNFNLMYAGLKESLPENVNILTFEPWTNGEYLLRLEHIFEKNEDDNLSAEISVDIGYAFNHFGIKKMTETTLGANELLSLYNQREKYTWTVNNNQYQPQPEQDDAEDTFVVKLKPMQIRTFILTLSSTPNPPTTESPTGFGVALQPVVSLTILIALLVVRL